MLLAAALGLGLCASGCAGAARAVLPAPAPGLLPAAAPGPAPAPSIAFNASSFTNGDFVSVAWLVPQYDAVGAARTDMVALFLANASDPQLNLPIKYKWAASADGYTANGAGSHTWAPGSVPPLFLPRPPLISCWLILQALWRRGRQQSAQRVRLCRRFRLINQRQDVVALFLRNVTRATQFSASRVLARSAPVRLQDPNNPQHLHLAIAAAERCAAHTQPVSCSICCMHALKLPGATQQALRIAARPAVSTALAAWHTAYTP